VSDAVTIQGSIQATPNDASLSGLPQVLATLAESFVVGTTVVPGRYDLTSDSPQSVSLGSMTVGANMVIVKPIGVQHVKLTVTSADGASQSFPVDTILILVSQNNPITALALTRDPGVETLVEVTLGGS
jgi:hypothetical protein